MPKARTLTAEAQTAALREIALRDTAARDRLLLLLSWRCGLRVAEIAQLQWRDVQDAFGRLGDTLRVRKETTKGRTRERLVPMTGDLRAALADWRAQAPKGACFVHETLAGPQSANALQLWFSRVYRAAGLEGCSSHSGRRTAITNWARNAGAVGCSLADVQAMAGHAFVSTTVGYVDANASAKAQLVAFV